jgi:hypothetical protein
MDQCTQKSEIAQFRESQELQENSARQGLYGSAVVASHEAITARMDRGAALLLNLLAEGKHKEVAILMETKTWGVEGEICHTTIQS